MVWSNIKWVALLITSLGFTAQRGEGKQQFLPPVEIVGINLTPKNPAFADATEDNRLDLFLEDNFFQLSGKSGTVVSLNKDFSIQSTLGLPAVGLGTITIHKIYPAHINNDIFQDLVVITQKGKYHTLINRGYNKTPKFMIGPKTGDIISSIGILESIIIRVSESVNLSGRPAFLWCGGVIGLLTVSRNLGLYIISDGIANNILRQGDITSFRVRKNKGMLAIISLERPQMHLHKQFSKGLNFTTTSWGLPNYAPAVALGDLDGNGEVDLIHSSIKGIFYRLGTKYNTFGPVKEIPLGLPAVGETVSDVVCADLNNDGIEDLLVSTNQLGRLALYFYEGKGKLRFQKHVVLQNTKYITRLASGNIPGEAFPRQLDLVDIDSNGSLDIIISDIAGANRNPVVLLLRNSGNYRIDKNQFGTGTPRKDPPTIGLIGQSLLGKQIGISLNSNAPNSYAILNFGTHIFKNIIGFPIIPWLDIRVFPVMASKVMTTDKYGSVTHFINLPKSFPYKPRLGFQWLVIDLKDLQFPIHSSKALETILK